MSYIENIYICLVAPLLIVVFCLKAEKKGHVLFLLGGMTACLLSSYVTTYLAKYVAVYTMSDVYADTLIKAIEIAPIVEELMKFVPILFYILAVAPKKDDIAERVLMVSVGFATFENVCYLITNGSDDLADLLIRGFGTGAMHVVCGMILAAGLVLLSDAVWLRAAGTLGLLAVAVTYHGVYNVLVAQTGVARVIGFAIPLFTTLVVIISRKLVVRRIQ